MRKQTPLGVQELEVLRFVSDRAPVTVGEVAREWGEPHGLARTTVLTMMERLRKKNFLTREPRERENTFEYRPAVQKADLMRSLVADFVERTLGGSLAPFVAYLNDARSLSPHEREALRRLVEEMDSAGNEEQR
jgi:predicted transcriptional regulator